MCARSGMSQVNDLRFRRCRKAKVFRFRRFQYIFRRIRNSRRSYFVFFVFCFSAIVARLAVEFISSNKNRTSLPSHFRLKLSGQLPRSLRETSSTRSKLLSRALLASARPLTPILPKILRCEDRFYRNKALLSGRRARIYAIAVWLVQSYFRY